MRRIGSRFEHGNLSGKFNSLDKALKNPDFLSGWREVRGGLPFDYDVDSFSYERGRQCAIVVRQVLGYIPPMPGGIELVRPVYLQCRLDQTISGDTSGLESLRGDDGNLNLDRYMRQFDRKADAAPGKLDSLLGF